MPHSLGGPNGSPEKEGPAMMEFLPYHGVEVADWFLGSQRLTHPGRPTDTWEGHGRGETCSLQVAEQVELPL